MIKRLVICAHLGVCAGISLLSLSAHASISNNQSMADELQVLKQAAPKLKEEVLRLALSAYDKASHLGLVHKPILTVIDYSQASSQERLWVFDLSKEKLLYETYVAHGRNSGDLYSTRFSNQNRSLESSLGTYVTSNTYNGSNGYSLNLQGLEQGYNDQALSRRVVMHGAWYVTEDFIKQHGQAGRSWGCPAVNPTLAKPIINTIKDGSVLFAYYPDKNWLSHSQYTHFA
jgi:hypothetical protein